MHRVTSVTFNNVRVYCTQSWKACSLLQFAVPAPLLQFAVPAPLDLKLEYEQIFLVLSSQSGDTRGCSLLRNYATSWKVTGSIPKKVTGFFNWPKPSNHIMTLMLTQPLPEMTARNLPGGKGQPAHKADNPTATGEQTVYKIWEPQCLTTLWASTACYGHSFTLVVNLT
jgi:hypothetical protein